MKKLTENKAHVEEMKMNFSEGFKSTRGVRQSCRGERPTQLELRRSRKRQQEM